MDHERRISKDQSARFHPELDFDRWQADVDAMHMVETDWAEVPEEYRDSGRQSWEQLIRDRQLMLDRVKARRDEVPDSVPTDVFIFDRGEAPDPAMTRIGGIPYWPKDRPWPTNWRGIPMTFVAQINLSDSRDLFDGLPGDLVMLFRGHRGGLKAIWLNADLEDRLSAEDVPKSVCLNRFERHGVIHRLYDDPSSPKPSQGIGDCHNFDCVLVGGKRWISRSKRPKSARLLFQIINVEIAKWDLDDYDDDFAEESVPDDVELRDCGPHERTSHSTLPPISGYLHRSGVLKTKYEYRRRGDEFGVDSAGYTLNRFGVWLLNVTGPHDGVLVYGQLFRWTLMKKAG